MFIRYTNCYEDQVVGTKSPVTFCLSPDLRAQVGVLAERCERSRSWIVETAIRHFLQQNAAKTLGARTTRPRQPKSGHRNTVRLKAAS